MEPTTRKEPVTNRLALQATGWAIVGLCVLPPLTVLLWRIALG